MAHGASYWNKIFSTQISLELLNGHAASSSASVTAGRFDIEAIPSWIPSVIERLAPLATALDIPLPAPVTPGECFNAISFFVNLAVTQLQVTSSHNGVADTHSNDVTDGVTPVTSEWVWTPPAFNPNVHKLKSVCKWGHEYPLMQHEDGTPGGLRNSSGNCIACLDKANWERKLARQTVEA